MPKHALISSGLFFVFFASTGCAVSGTTSNPSSGTGGAETGGGGVGGGSGGVTGGTGGASGGVAGAGGVEVDYGNGTWTLEKLSNTPGTISHDGRLVFIQGKEIIAWSEPDSVDTSDQDIFAGSLGQAKAITNDDKIQNAFPALGVVNDQSVLVWSGYADGDNDVYLATGPKFTNPVNLTGAGSASGLREDFAPWFVSSSEEQAVAYLSSAELFADDAEVRVLTWSGTPSSLTPTTVITGKGDCDDPSIARDPKGMLHLIAPCGPLFQEHTYYATNASGQWTVEDISGGTSGNYATRILLSASGDSLIAIWLDSNQNLQLSTAALGGPWKSPNVIIQQASWPVVTIDAFDRILIAFHRMNSNNMADVFFAWSHGTSFSEPVSLTPNTDGSDEWLPSALVLEPDTGNPQVLYSAIEQGAEPFNSDVWRAKFVPNP